jgi:hypothetical protein
VLPHHLELARVGQRRDVGEGAVGRADAQLRPHLAQPLHQGVGDAALDVDDLDRPARLAGVAQRPVGDAGHGALEVAVGQDDGRVLAPISARRGLLSAGSPLCPVVVE